MSRRDLRPLLRHLRREAGSLVSEAIAGRTDEEVADLLIEVADALVAVDAIPGVGPLVEILSDVLLLHLLRPRAVEWVAAARARQAALGSP